MRPSRRLLHILLSLLCAALALALLRLWLNRDNSEDVNDIASLLTIAWWAVTLSVIVVALIDVLLLR